MFAHVAMFQSVQHFDPNLQKQADMLQPNFPELKYSFSQNLTLICISFQTIVFLVSLN
jgi:hypothetical protein